jgi:hypothetical protein
MIKNKYRVRIVVASKCSYSNAAGNATSGTGSSLESSRFGRNGVPNFQFPLKRAGLSLDSTVSLSVML